MTVERNGADGVHDDAAIGGVEKDPRVRPSPEIDRAGRQDKSPSSGIEADVELLTGQPTDGHVDGLGCRRLRLARMAATIWPPSPWLLSFHASQVKYGLCCGP